MVSVSSIPKLLWEMTPHSYSPLDELFVAFNPSLLFSMKTPIVEIVSDASRSAGFRFHVSCFLRRNVDAFLSVRP